MEVGIEELFDMCYHVSMKDTNTILSMLDSELKAVITPMKVTPAELKALTPAVQTFSDASALQKVSQDVRIYIEVCIAHKQLKGSVVMLVTDDHKFF